MLLAVMVFSNLPTSTALAMEDSTTQKTESEHLESDAVLEAGNRLNYILVESPYLEAPNMQNIVVSWGDGTEQISNMRSIIRFMTRNKVCHLRKPIHNNKNTIPP